MTSFCARLKKATGMRVDVGRVLRLRVALRLVPVPVWRHFQAEFLSTSTYVLAENASNATSCRQDPALGHFLPGFVSKYRKIFCVNQYEFQLTCQIRCFKKPRSCKHAFAQLLHGGGGQRARYRRQESKLSIPGPIVSKRSGLHLERAAGSPKGLGQNAGVAADGHGAEGGGQQGPRHQAQHRRHHRQVAQLHRLRQARAWSVARHVNGLGYTLKTHNITAALGIEQLFLSRRMLHVSDQHPDPDVSIMLLKYVRDVPGEDLTRKRQLAKHEAKGPRARESDLNGMLFSACAKLV